MRKSYPSDINREEFAKIEPLLVSARKITAPRKLDLYDVYYKFRRQHILCGYIVDFVCLEKRLIIELDGGQHVEKIEYDATRTLKLKADGFQVLRFWNNEIFNNMDSVLECIYEALNNTPHPPQKTRRPLPQGER